MSKKQENSCSFCGRPESQVNLLISGVSGFICDECVSRAHQLLNEEIAHRSKSQVPANALEKFGEDIDGQKALLVPPSVYTLIRNTKDWAPASEFAAGALVRGAVGQIFGCDIMVSNRLTASQNAYIVKPGALRLVLKRDTLLEADRDILRRVNVYTATKHYVTYLYNAANAIKLTT